MFYSPFSVPHKAISTRGQALGFALLWEALRGLHLAGCSAGARYTVMAWVAQSLGLGQARSATESPSMAHPAVLRVGGPRGPSNSALEVEEASKFKILEARIGDSG